MRAAIRALPPEGRGILCFLGTILLFSIMDAIAKDLTRRMDPLQVVWARYASQTAWAFLLLAPRLGRLLRTRFPGLQLVRSAALFGATISFFFGFSVLPLATNAAIFQVGPLFVTALGFVVLKERVGPRRLFAVLAGLAGAMIIIRPGSALFTPHAVLPLIAAFFYAGYMISTRFLGGEESPWTSFLYTALFGTVAASLMVPFVWTTPAAPDAVLMAMMGLIGGLGHLLLITALGFAQAATVAPFAYASLVFSAIWGYALFGEIPDRWTWIGALVIVGAGLYVWHRERRIRRAAG